MDYTGAKEREIPFINPSLIRKLDCLILFHVVSLTTSYNLMLGNFFNNKHSGWNDFNCQWKWWAHVKESFKSFTSRVGEVMYCPHLSWGTCSSIGDFFFQFKRKVQVTVFLIFLESLACLLSYPTLPFLFFFFFWTSWEYFAFSKVRRYWIIRFIFLGISHVTEKCIFSRNSMFNTKSLNEPDGHVWAHRRVCFFP